MTKNAAFGALPGRLGASQRAATHGPLRRPLRSTQESLGAATRHAILGSHKPLKNTLAIRSRPFDPLKPPARVQRYPEPRSIGLI